MYKPNQEIKLTSTCDYILRTSVIPILFIKLKEKREENPLGGYTWMICVDGSEKSFKAFELGIKLYNKFYDKLLIVYSSPAQKSKFLKRQSDQIVEFYNKELNSRKLENAAFIHVEAQDLQTIQETLVLFVHRYHTDIEFVIAGSNGRRAEIEDQQKVVSVIGSTALELLKKCKSNVLIHK